MYYPILQCIRIDAYRGVNLRRGLTGSRNKPDHGQLNDKYDVYVSYEDIMKRSCESVMKIFFIKTIFIKEFFNLKNLNNMTVEFLNPYIS